MATASEIRNQLARWFDGEISLRQFEDWFVPATWDVHRANDPEAESLTDNIELNLSEYSDGTLSARELREELEELTKVVRPFSKSFHWVEGDNSA